MSRLLWSADLKYLMSDTVKIMSQRTVNDSKGLFFFFVDK